ncbi:MULTISPECIES: DUF3575 domain-containing protein [Niastella]|uniref:DUF3575 domain-containing protein n=1 Tax=Niastella soli TaxID=2821487 RepID=A0ABS3YT08_9BACT|nr:DUF3575 domain-containing protein [Niastella soli]MBO9200979.1 DUF3575 domain-containing protein [Niastella soli]
MYRTCFLCLLLLLVTVIGNAQKYKSKTYFGDTGKVKLRMNFLGLADLYDGNVSIGGEIALNKRLSVIMDAGYICYSAYLPRIQKTSGIIFRPGIRLTLGQYRNTFIDLQFHYKGVRYTVNGWLDKDVVNNVPTFQEYKKFQIQKRVSGGQITFGGKESITQNGRWYLEFYIGVGLHYREENLYNEPGSEYGNGFSFIIPIRAITSDKHTHVTVAVPAGIRLVYNIK